MFALDNENVSGVLNASSPNPVRMNQFCRVLGNKMNRPSVLKIPAFVLRIIFGEAAEVLLTGSQVLLEKTIEAGYKFYFEKVENALDNLLR